jgi:DNA-binding transcriptional ArsR family regulator
MKRVAMPGLDAAFAALSDPTRRAILARLALGETTVMKLAEPFEMTQPAISRHLKVLEGAGLIVRRVEGTKRPCRLAKAGMETIDQWLAIETTTGWTRFWQIWSLKVERTSNEQDDPQDRRG